MLRLKMTEELDQYTLPRLLQKDAARFGSRVALRKKEFGIWHDISCCAYA